MKISVIIVCKNEKDTIGKTLKSVFAQTYKNFEIIVVDGNSTDGTLELLKKYINIKLITGQEQGIYPAMNAGIEESTGEILYFLNANDSLFSNDIFEKITKAFIKNNCDLIYGDTNFQSLDKNGKTNNTYISHKDFYSKFVWAYRNINHQSTFYKKWLFDKYGKYNTNFQILADVDFTTKVIIKKNVSSLYLPFLIANYDTDGLSSYKNAESYKILKKEKQLIAKNYLTVEYTLFSIYNVFFNNFLIQKINNSLKSKFGLNIILKIRDTKRNIGRIFFWWMRKI